MVSSELRKMYPVIWLVQLIVSSFARSTQYSSKGSGSDTSMLEALFPKNNSLPHVNSTESSSLGASAIPQCDSIEYGINLDRGSCFDAWRNMGWDDKKLRWAQRGSTQDFDVLLPYRWSSGTYFETSCRVSSACLRSQSLLT